MKITIGKSGTHDISINLETLFTTRLLVTSDSGGGKTFALKNLCEGLFGKVPICVIDPEGEFAPLREKFPFALVAGEGGDALADPRSAGLLAHRMLEHRFSLICDIYELKPEARHIFVKNFIEGLIEAPRKWRHPTIVIVDEAHMFCPEGKAGESEATSAMKSLCTRGRKRGLTAVFATQRLAELNKGASSMLLNRLVGGTFEGVNQKRALEVLSITPEEKQKFLHDVKLLEPGFFYALGRAICKERTLVHIGPIQTPHGDSALKYAVAAPPPPEAIAKLLPKLADLPKEAEDRAKSIADLKSEVRSLKAQLRSQPTATKEIKIIDEKAIERAVTQSSRQFISQIERLKKTLANVADLSAKAANVEVHIDTKTVPPVVRHDYQIRKETRPNPTQHAEARIPARVERNGDAKLRSGAERMLAALATWAPNGMTEGQMRAHAELKKSGTFSAYMSDLRKGFIEERGGMVFATQQGLDYCQHIPAAPQSTEDVLAIWNPKLRDGARRMLDALVQKGGEPISKEELGELAQLQKSGTFSAYLSDLKTARLVSVNRDGTVAANKETLFL